MVVFISANKRFAEKFPMILISKISVENSSKVPSVTL